MKHLFALSVLFMIAFTLKGQAELSDTIYTKDGRAITGKVKEIGTAEVKYIQPQINPEVVYVINTDKIERIVFFNGKEQWFEEQPPQMETIEQNSETLFQQQKKQALKIDFLAIAANSLTLTYEKCLQPGRMFEISAGYIGIGTGLEDEKASGILLRGGYKFARNPDFFIREMRYTHILKGAYVKLEFDFASYRVEGRTDLWDERETYNNTKWAILVVAGNQWIFNDNFLIDLYSGIGIGGNSLEDNDLTYPYGFATLGSDFPLALSLGVRIGVLLK